MKLMIADNENFSNESPASDFLRQFAQAYNSRKGDTLVFSTPLMESNSIAPASDIDTSIFEDAPPAQTVSIIGTDPERNRHDLELVIF